MKKMTLKDIKITADSNWRERTHLIASLREVLTPTIEKKIRKVDPNFLRKLYNFPGDVTTHRISKVLSSI